VHKAIVDVLYRGIECFQQSRTQFFATRNGGFRDLNVYCEYMTAKWKAVAMPSAGAAHRTKRQLGFLWQAATTDGASGKDEFSE
jgi:hypothetical protein